MYTSIYKNFTNEVYDRLLLFFYNNNDNIEAYSSNIIIKIKNSNHSYFSNKKVFKTDDNGNLLSLIGRTKLDEEIKTTDVVQYSLIGVNEINFLDEINQNINFEKCISLENIHLIEKLEVGMTIYEIAKSTKSTEEKLNNNIQGLFKRFKLNNTEELIKFAFDNYLIPNQFDKYIKL